MNLLGFYELKESPFSTSVDSRFFYGTHQHAEALVRLTYATENMKGLCVLVGGIGTGKTTLATRLLEELDPNTYEAALLVVIHAGVSSEWMLRKMAYQMEVPSPGETKTELLTQLSRRLLEVHESGKKAVVLIDEAQMLRSQELMEDFRGLLNIEIDGSKALTFVLFGLMELDHALALDPALRQRVAIRYELTPLDAGGTEAEQDEGEAQMLRSQELMEDFRGLLNIEIDGSKALTFVLFGLMELDHALALDPALRQRVAVRYELAPLDAGGTEAYVLHRLGVAGARHPIFAPGTFPTICHYAQGIPRLINGLCDNALLEGYLRKQESIEEPLIHEIAKDLKLDP